MLNDSNKEKTPSRRVSSLEAAGIKVATSSPTVRKKAPVLPSPISTARTGRSHNAGIRTPNSAVSPAIPSRLAKTPPLKSRLTPSNSKDTASLKKKMYNSSTTRRSSSRLSINSSTSSISLTPTTSKASNNGCANTTSIKKSLVVEELKDKYQEAQAALATKDSLLKEREADLKDAKSKLEHLQFELEQQISANKCRTDEKVYLDQLHEQQQQFIMLKQSLESEKSDILLNQEATEQKNRQNLENLREKLEIEKDLLNNTMIEKNRNIEKLNHELNEMRDNIKEMHQAHQTRLTVMSNQLESKYEHRITQLLEQLNANELQEEQIKQNINAEETQKCLEIELENQRKQLNEAHDLEIQSIKSKLMQFQLKHQELSKQNIDIKVLKDNQIIIETALETEKLKYANLVTKYDDLARKKERDYLDLQHEVNVLQITNDELKDKVQVYEYNEKLHADEIRKLKMTNTNALELRSTLKYQQLQEEQTLKEIDIAKHELNEEYKQQFSVQKATYTKETSQFQDKIDKLQFELNVCIDKLNQSNENQTKKSIMNETSTYKKDCDLHGDDASKYKLLVHQHQKELNVLQEQFQFVLDAKDDQINDLVYKVKQSQYEEKEEIVDGNDNEQKHFTSPPPNTLLNSNLTTPLTPLKRTRAKRSCDFCRKRKSRCDADASTPCSNCKAWGYTCEFQTVRKKRGPPSVYVDNLEKKCKKMESLLSALTNCSIKDLERNEFQYAGHIQPSSPPNASDSSSEDEENDSEHDFDLLNEATKDYDSLKYTGQSSAGLKLFNNDIFKSQSTIPWPGRENIVLKLMAQDELMIVRTEKSSTTGKSDMLFDVGLSMRAPLFDKQKSNISLLKNSKKPARHQLDKIIGMYFSHIHLILPIINKTKFLEQYHNSSSAGPPSILMQAVLALTFRFASQRLPDLVKDADEFADTYFRKVMKRLRDSVKSRLCHVQAALLMSLYLDMDDGDVESAQWCTVGNAIRMAQDLGLHRSCAKWNLPRSEIETRHRVFYACYVMDRWLGARAGKPLTILDRDFDAEMPSPYEITDDSTDTNLGAPIYRSFIALIKLSEILGRVLKALYAPNAKIANTNAGLDDPTILAVFERRLLNWKSSLEEPLDGAYLSKLDKVLLLHRPFNQLSIEKYPNLKSIVAESEKACTDAANQLSAIVNQRQYQTSDPAYYYVLCAPSCYVYALFQSSLVYLSNALRTRNSQDIQGFHQSINLIKMNDEIGPAPRAVEILNMLASINGLYIDNKSNKSNSMSDESSNFTITAITSASNSTDSPALTPPIYSTNTYSDHPSKEPPRSHYIQHRVMNTSIIGGITPDIQSDIGIPMSPSSHYGHEQLQQMQLREQNSSHHHHQQQQQLQQQQHHHHHHQQQQQQQQQQHHHHHHHHQQQQQHQQSQHQQQVNCYVQPQYPVYGHSTPAISHQRSFSLDQPNSSTHYSHTRSISHDINTTNSTNSPTNITPTSSEPPYVSTSLAMNVNSMLSTCYTPQNNSSNNNNMNHMIHSYRPLPQTPQAYTAAYDPNMNVSNSTLPPSSLNWSDWDVYLGHQNQNSPGQQQQQQQQSNQPTSSPSQHIQYS